MSDWVIDDSDNTATKGIKNPGDWEIVPDENAEVANLQPESLGKSLAYAIPRVGTDIAKNAYNFSQQIPSYINKAKNELPNMLAAFATHPLHTTVQALAGVNEAINSLAQAPKNLAQYGESRLNLVPQSAVNAISAITPEDTTGAINQLFGQPKYPGEAVIRGIARNAPNLATAGEAANLLNPLNLTSKNIAKNVVAKRAEKIEKYSGQNGLYPNLFNDARQQGLGQVNFNPNNVDIHTIEQTANPKFTSALNRFLISHDIEDAHWAQSDLGKYIEQMNKRPSLTNPEINSLNAAKNAQNEIKNNMFSNNSLFQKRYGKISQGYAKEVIPYKNNPDIKNFMKDKMLPSELVNSLSRGEFAAKRGMYHPAIAIRNILSPLAPFGLAGGLGGTLGYLLANRGSQSSNQ